MDFWYKFGRLMAILFMRTFGRVEIVGAENIPPFGSLIVTPNHQSYADPPLLTTAFNRPLFYMGKRSLFANPVVSYLLRSFHVYPVSRDKRDVDAVHWALDLLDRGKVLAVFPEGTRGKGGLRKAEVGAAYLAQKSGASIIPVAITGTEHVQGFIRIAFPFHRLKVVIGEAYSLPQIEGQAPREVLQSFTDMIMGRIAALLPPEYQGDYKISPPPPPRSI
jgi:1-acyl-sn-glycerol-3-phosphate acyltransferase